MKSKNISFILAAILIAFLSRGCNRVDNPPVPLTPTPGERITQEPWEPLNATLPPGWVLPDPDE